MSPSSGFEAPRWGSSHLNHRRGRDEDLDLDHRRGRDEDLDLDHRRGRDEDLDRRPGGMTRYRVGGLLLLLAALYFVGEAWAAAGWEGRPYSWSGDAISELGVPEVRHGREGTMAATHHLVMNATFLGSGLRLLLATGLLAPFVPRRARRTVLVLAVAQGLGLVVVGLFPTGTHTVRADVHGVGAVLVIAGGSALLVALAVAMTQWHPGAASVTALLAVVSVLGTIGAVSGVGGFGLVERAAVYALLVWQVLAGIGVLLGRPPAP